METGKLGQDDPQNIFIHLSRNEWMGTRIQRLLYPDGSPGTTDHEMADLLKKIFQGFYRADKWSNPSFRHLHPPSP